MAKRTLKVGDLTITLSGPAAAVDGGQVNVNYILTDQPRRAVAAVDALGGIDEFSSEGEKGREQLVIEPDFSDIDSVGVVVSSVNASPHLNCGPREVLGRWRDRPS